MKKTIALVSAILLLLTGCSSSETKTVEGNVTGQGAPITTEGESENVINLSMSVVRSLNPIFNTDETVNNVFSLMYEKLINIGSDGKAEPNIAESWSFNDEGNVLTLNLRNDVCFSDGSSLTAYDVAYSLKTIDRAEASYYKNCSNNIKTWSVSSDYSMTVTFYNDGGNNIYYLSFPVISRTLYGGDYAVDSDSPNTALTNGLYRFDSLAEAKQLSLVASLNCFKGMAEVEKVMVTMTKDRSTQINLFSQGISDLLPADETELAGQSTAVGVNKTNYVTNIYDFIGFNFNNNIFGDRNIRQAIAYSVDQDSIIESVYLGNAEKAYSPISSSSWLYDKNVYGYDYDIQTAKMLLEQSGWRFRTSSSVRENTDGGKLSATILVNKENNERNQIAQIIADSLKVLGFEISIDSVDYETYKQRVESGSFDILVGSWTLSPVNDFSFMFETGNNSIGYSSEKMDEYIKNCNTAVTDEQMTEAYGKFQKYVSQELPYISLVFRQSSVYSSQRLQGDIIPARYNVFNGIKNVTVK
ncbi:Oligopeptide-binding protein AppA [bioreactor metagenome]|uniref:Oligopeptide-binding protein AppA n=1 Tax=bioreactor metagenome TaxID=1076179 RepID=A0A645BPN5_9ZZZZ|nr:peptide ABC transporter substrate-binding protein [Candidatus Metalachnospira sp.]